MRVFLFYNRSVEGELHRFLNAERYGKTPWITSSYIPTLKGKLFFLDELAGPLIAECN